MSEATAASIKKPAKMTKTDIQQLLFRARVRLSR